MSWQRAPLYTRVHRLCVWFAGRRAGSSPPSRAIAACEEGLAELLVAVSAALSFPAVRDAQLQIADLALLRVRVLLRVAHDTQELPSKTLRWLASELDSCGRMLGGWRRSRSDRLAPPPLVPDPS
jgi:hypothetical protein